MINVLKTITQKKLGFKVDEYNTSKKLSEIIYIETGFEISYNTPISQKIFYLNILIKSSPK